MGPGLLRGGPPAGRALTRAAPIKAALAAWEPGAVRWDGAGAHRARLLAGLPTTRIRLPAYNAQLNPVERAFREIRRRSESRVYAAVADT